MRLCAVLLLVLAIGCRGEKSPPEEKTAAPPAEQTVVPTETQDGSPRDPEAAMRQMVEGLRANRPEVIWQAIPPGFQRDINSLVHEFARKMDPELWRTSFETWKTFARLLAEKKSAILNHPELAQLSPEQRRRLETNWDGLVELLTILVNSELADLEQLKTFEMGRFLEKTGGRWLTQLAGLSESLGQDSLSGMLAGLEPKTLSVDKDVAQMAWVTKESAEPVSRFSLVKLENQWVPAGWTAAWDQVRTWRAKLRQMPADAFAEQSQEKLQALTRAERIMQALLATKAAEEFQRTLNEQLGEQTVRELAAVIRTLSGAPLAATRNNAEPVAENIPKTATDANSVTLLISGAQGTRDEDRIFDTLQSALPGDVDVQFESTKTGLKVIVGPVADFDQFRQNLKLGSITKFDKAQRTLHIEITQ